MDEIVNRVAKSGLITFDLETLWPEREVVEYDLAQNLWQGLVLREKEFRDFVKNHDWSTFQDHHVGLLCSADAIVPSWAYMLLTTALEPYAASVEFGEKEKVTHRKVLQAIEQLNEADFKDARVIIKGCGDREVPMDVWVAITARLKPWVKILMYGEPCSTVPVYKRKG
ncbi:DUF2480 family protein [bacterium SCSIO 12741]|nr:DUF2480 family protein [bacterium SCSIO 12741]